MKQRTLSTGIRDDASAASASGVSLKNSHAGAAAPALYLSRMTLLSALANHPASVGETYAAHLRRACRFGLHMVFGCLGMR